MNIYNTVVCRDNDPDKYNECINFIESNSDYDNILHASKPTQVFFQILENDRLVAVSLPGYVVIKRDYPKPFTGTCFPKKYLTKYDNIPLCPIFYNFKANSVLEVLDYAFETNITEIDTSMFSQAQN